MTIFFGLCASVLLVGLSLAINRKMVVIFSALLVIFTSLQYLSLDKMIPVYLNLIAFAYALIVPLENKFPWLKSKITVVILFATYTTLFFTLNGFNFNIEILTYVASVSGVILMTVENAITAKWIMLVTGISWTLYMLAVGAYGQVPGEIFFISGVVFSLFYLYKNKNQDTIPELGHLMLGKITKNKNKNYAKQLKAVKELV